MGDGDGSAKAGPGSMLTIGFPVRINHDSGPNVIGYPVARRGGLLDRLGVLGELLRFMWARKLWWLVPMMVVLVLLVAVLVFAQGSAVAPFIYTLF